MGKSVLILLSLASLYVWAVILKKTTYLLKIMRNNRALEEYVKSMPKVKRLIVEEPSMNFEIYDKLFTLYVNQKDDIAKNLSEIEEEIVQKWEISMEKDLNYLSTIGSIAPFVGLFGTVWGIMNSFQSIAACQSTSIAIVAPGLSEALFATAVGLFVAIPATASVSLLYSYIDKIVKNFRVFSVFTRDKFEETKNGGNS